MNLSELFPALNKGPAPVELTGRQQRRAAQAARKRREKKATRAYRRHLIDARINGGAE